MIRNSCHKSFLIISLWLLISCSNIQAGGRLETTSIPQLPLDQAETIVPSPDGKWVAYFFGSQHIDYKLSVVNFDNTIVWNINQANLLDSCILAFSAQM